jgi:uncharacterized protein YbcI
MSKPISGTPAVTPPRGEQLAAISTRLVQLLREAIGKGPTRCKTYWAGDDIVLVLAGGGLLKSEETLFRAGRSEQVMESRRVLHEVLEQPMREIIEEVVGRRVIAFMSASHDDPDLMAEIFVLEPQDGDLHAA